LLVLVSDPDDRSNTTPPLAPEHSIPGLLQRTTAHRGAATALQDGHHRLTYLELLDQARQVAAALLEMVAPGERVAVWGPNSVEWAVATFAVLFAGGTVVPLNSRYTVPEAADIVARAGCRVIFAEREFHGRRLAEETTVLAPSALVIGMGPGDKDGVARDGVATLAELLDRSPSQAGVERRLARVTPLDVSHVQFTSGTTGRPKGAMLRHEAMVRTTADWARAVGLRSADRYPVIAPFSHIGGHKTGLLASVTAGCAALPFATFDLDRLVGAIEDHGVTVLQGPPTMFQALVAKARAESRRFSTLRVAVTGAATIAPSLIRDMLDVLGVEQAFAAYGLTETTGICTITRAGDPVETIAETSGRPVPDVEVNIVDEEGRGVPMGTRGEIVVRGFNVMAGYMDDPAATEEAVRDGWLHTGDVGWVGDDGCLRIVDRLKDMIIVGGFNAYPAEIEHALLEQGGVDQVAVVGIPDERLGEVPFAFVVLRPGTGLDAGALHTYCRARLANFKRPRTILLVEALPVNAAGKVLKGELRDRAVEQPSTTR
jgi:acyl-CoA synthetase (AMP-forming)/AMP-acid ligase II